MIGMIVGVLCHTVRRLYLLGCVGCRKVSGTRLRRLNVFLIVLGLDRAKLRVQNSKRVIVVVQLKSGNIVYSNYNRSCLEGCKN